MPERPPDSNLVPLQRLMPHKEPMIAVRVTVGARLWSRSRSWSRSWSRSRFVVAVVVAVVVDARRPSLRQRRSNVEEVIVSMGGERQEHACAGLHDRVRVLVRRQG